LNSVFAQSLPAIDLIIIDDHSVDHSVRVVEEWMNQQATRFRRALLLRHERNLGPAAARNSAIAQAETPFVFILDADNLLYSTCLEKLYASLQNCDATFAYSYLKKFGERTGIKNLGPWQPTSLTQINHVDAMVLLRKSAWKEVGGYTENKFTRIGWEDYDFWFKIARIDGWGVSIPEILAQYRSHKQSRSYHTQNPNAHRLLWYLYRTYPEFWQSKSQKERWKDYLQFCKIFVSRTIGKILGWKWLY
ncbi:MAG: glycosyltransferase family 2 protein, partial [Saprospiraceae bacterium]